MTVNFFKVLEQGPLRKHGFIDDPMLLFQITFMALAPDADLMLILRQRQAGQVVVPAQLISQSVAIIENVLVHRSPPFVLSRIQWL